MGATTIAPGQSTTLTVAFSMHEGMGGPHHFDVVIPSSDPIQPEQVVSVKARYP